MTAVAFGQARSADVLYTYFDDAPVHGYRVGDECFVPVNQLAHIGWQVDVRADLADIKAEGSEINLPVRSVAGQTTVPLRAAMTQLGGSAEWIVNTDTLQVLSELKSFDYQSGRIRVNSPLFIKPRPFVLTDPDRIVIDYVGARLGPKTEQTIEGGVRISQFKPNVVRLVIQTATVADISQIPNAPTKSSELELAEANTDGPSSHTGADKSVAATAVPLGNPGDQAPANLQINVDHEDAQSATLFMNLPTLKGEAHFQKPDPSTLEVDLPGVFLDLAPDFKPGTDAITDAKAQRFATGTVLTLSLVRPLGAEVSTNGHRVSIELIKPNVGNGKLLGKIVVVDPGHGGQDSGARAAGLCEKNLTLPIGRLLAADLAAEGATVILTRTTDVFIPLTTRAQIANKSHADFFVSCHINDSGGGHDMAGTITFHHKDNAISTVLAECIQHEIGRVSGVPSVGVWSDGKIYESGFSVLRNTKMPGVLIEFGFIDNASDRKRMVTDDFKEAVAKAVVRGIKVYLGDAKAN